MLDEIKTSMRIVRGVNYSVGKQHFTVIVLCYLSQLSTFSAALNDVYDETQMAVCSLPVEKEEVYAHIICMCFYIRIYYIHLTLQ